MSTIFWLADARSVAYLDLHNEEFREKKEKMLIEALDLSYEFCPSFPNMSLIQIFRTKKGVDLDVTDSAAAFFSSFSRNLLKKLIKTWEQKTMRLYLKYLKCFSYFIEQFLYPVCSENSYAIFGPIGRQERLVINRFPSRRFNLIRSQRYLFQESLMSEAAQKLGKILFEKVNKDSYLVAEFFHTVCISWDIKAQMFFDCEPAVTEYILCNLQKAKCNLIDIWIKDLENGSIPEWELQSLIRKKPNHFFVLLKYGLKNVHKYFQFPELIKHMRFQQTEGPLRLWQTREFFFRGLEEDMTPKTKREIVILEAFVFFLSCPLPDFRTYLKSLRFIWKCIPDAYITYKEVRHVLFRYLPRRNAECTYILFRKYGFEGFKSVSQPRTLMHQSRCAIMDALSCNSQLPQGIELLGLPSRLESYMRLEF